MEIHWDKQQSRQTMDLGCVEIKEETEDGGMAGGQRQAGMDGVMDG